MRNSRHFLSFVLAVVAILSPLRAEDTNHPPVEQAPAAAPVAGQHPAVQAAADPARLGLGVQRALTLMAGSTPAHHNAVRVLFYGQSITEQEWSKQVGADLRRRFPDADFDIQNRAIGGFASQLLIRPAEHDLYPFYPDLVIFHVYGADNTYEEIIRNIRTRTTADVLMQTDHATAWPPEVVDRTQNKGKWWDDYMNHIFLPDTAKKFGCGLADIRTDWLAYLKTNQLEPETLLADGVHLNEFGNFLMSSLINRYLVYRPELPKTDWQENVRDIPLGGEVAWRDGKLTLKFEGNRIDVLPASAGEGAVTATADVLIDGKKPSEFPECYAITRPTPGPWSPLFISRVDHEAPLLVEDWTYTVTSLTPDGKWAFQVSGSVTGADGEGTSDQPFVSKSKRVKIDPQVYFRPPGKAIQFAAGYKESWKVVPLFTDSYRAPKDFDATRDNAMVFAQGLSNASHTLELRANGNALVPIKAFRVYRPPVKK